MCVHACLCVFLTCVCVCACVHACMCTCVCVCVCACVSAFICMFGCVLKRVFLCVLLCVQYVFVCVCSVFIRGPPCASCVFVRACVFVDERGEWRGSDGSRVVSQMCPSC